MIFEAQRYDFVFWDAVYSMGVGFAVGFVYQLLSVFLYKGRLAVFVKDIAIGCIFTIAVFSFVVSFANYKVLRWYNVAFALLGRVMFTPQFGLLLHRWGDMVVMGVKTAVKKVFKGIYGKFLTKKDKNVEKPEEFSQENENEVLKRTEFILYN